MYDVLIVGCGITGAACAFELSKYNLKIAVLEKENDVAAGTTKANSAIIHAGYDPVPGSLMAKLNVRGSVLAGDICRKLDVPYENCGALVLAFSGEDLKTLEVLKKRGDENGVPGLELLGRDRLKETEPMVSDEALGALYAPSSAIVSPWEYCLAMAETAVRNGTELFLETEVKAIEKTENGFTVKTDKGEFATRLIVNASGCNAEEIHDMAAPHAFEIIPAKGQYYLLDKEEHSKAKHTIFRCPNENGKGILVSPTVHGNLIVGPDSTETDSGDDRATTREGLDYVALMGRKSVPSVNFGNTIRNFAGVRAKSSRGDFIVEEAAGCPGFIDASGICSPGLSAAPAIAETVVQIASARIALEKKEDFVCSRSRVRFKELDDDRKAELIKQNSAYGRIICRCETVTEGEIEDCFSTPIPPVSIDGVKRRVGAGLGRCQGGFCSPRVLALISKHTGKAPEEIMKEDSGSFILTGKCKE